MTPSTSGRQRAYSFGSLLAPDSELDFGHAGHEVADPGLSDPRAAFFAQTMHVAHADAPVVKNNRLLSD
jgi:hypothetical protein